LENRSRIATLFVSEAVVVTVIIINALALFLDAFPRIHSNIGVLLGWIDYCCLLFFIVELLYKSEGLKDFEGYWKLGWNRLDFFVIVASLPILIGPVVQQGLDEFAIALLFRLVRLLRFIRVLRYVPNATRILHGVGRAMKASVGILLLLLIVNAVLGIGATLLFGHIPEAQVYFGNPLRSMYSMFKVFTIEGWYEIPEQMSLLGISQGYLVGMHTYFTVSVLLGGIIGLSVANAVFVDEMMADNTETVEHYVQELRKELMDFREEYRRDRSSP